jgi:glycosyltransferase involved in cell wall biosynthesis
MKHIGLMISALNSGGAERVVAHLSHILSELYDVHVILFEDTYMEYECGGTVHSLDVPAAGGSVFTKIKLLRMRIQRLKALIKREKLDCVISFLDSPSFVNLFTRVSRCRKIISIRNYSGLENRQSNLGRLTDFAMKQLYRRADHVVTVSRLIQQDFCSHYGIPNHKISTIYNPYNFAQIDEKAREPLSAEETAFYDGHFVVANVGRVMYQKGIWHLLKAFSLAHKENAGMRLVLVGEDLTDGKLEKLIWDLGLGTAVLRTGRSRNPYKYLKNADMYVLSSLFEGFPNAMVEAMACGCPVVAADCKSGPREILFENTDLSEDILQTRAADYGVLVPCLEPEENWDASKITEGERKLAAAILDLSHSDTELNRYSQLAKQRSGVFSYDSCKWKYQTIIESKK